MPVPIVTNFFQRFEFLLFSPKRRSGLVSHLAKRRISAYI
ncbi:hypothetical protein CHELA40_14375 [Chelatococcus asaccharovorans]|nr:hypothetical protein CHELA17_61245 [Chelatococcus asaccharovorans]CAH1677096.1 hypothetical protein CHELA40_14375 [Chelatococcus asaccharovorans]